MENNLNILFVESSQSDTLLIIKLLALEGYIINYLRVETCEQMTAAMQDRTWDLVLAENNIAQFDALAILSVYHEKGLEIPIIILSNDLSDEHVITLMKKGAHDYITKDQVGRLIPVIARELKVSTIRKEKTIAEKALIQTENKFHSFFSKQYYRKLSHIPCGSVDRL